MAGKKTTKKRNKRIVPSGRCYINAGFGNTIVTITDGTGGAICWSTAGMLGFKGSRNCLLYTSPSPRDQRGSRMPSSA